MSTRTLDDKDLQAHYDALFNTTATPGWEIVMDKVEAYRKEASDIANVNAEHSVDFRRGQVDMCRWLLGMKETHESQFEILLDEQDWERP